MLRIKKALNNGRESFRDLLHNPLHEGHRFAHCAYFGTLFIEGHSTYAMIGGVLFVFSIMDIFSSEA